MSDVALSTHAARIGAWTHVHNATALYTREPVVDGLLARVDWPNEARVLMEPSCGDGAFLVAALHRLLDVQPNLDAAGIAARLQGWEVYPPAAEAARDNLISALLSRGWTRPLAREVAELVVRRADFLTEGPEVPVCDVVAGNPPYLRAANVPPILRTDYDAVVPEHARADLLHAFLDRCARVLRPRGEIAFVTSESWLRNEGAALLRETLGRRFTITHLQPLDRKTSFYRPKLRRRGTPPRVEPVAVVLDADAPGRALTASPIYPRAGSEAPAGPRLRDVARVRVAPWLGPRGIFVLDRDEATHLPLDRLVPCVDAKDILPDGTLREPTKVALRTAPGEEHPPAVASHLISTAERMPERGRRNLLRGLPPEPFHAFPLGRPALLLPRIATRLRPVRLPPGVLPIDHGLTVVQRESGLDDLERALTSSDADAWVRARAGRLENGYYSITTRLLRELPLGGTLA